MELFTKKLVPKSSAQLIPDNTLSSFTSFLPKLLNLEDQWEVAILEKSYPSGYQSSTEGYIMFLTRNFQSRQNCIIWNLIFTLPIGISLRPWTLSFKKDPITMKTVSRLKCLEERKKLRYTVQMKYLVLHSSVRTWHTYSAVILALKLERCWEEKDPENQNLLPIFSAYIHSRDTRQGWVQ